MAAKKPRKRVGKKSAARSYRSTARTRPEIPDTLMRLGRRVRVLREKAGLSQEEAASNANLDPKHWQKLEAGKVNVTVATLVGVRIALGVGLGDLFDV